MPYSNRGSADASVLNQGTINADGGGTISVGSFIAPNSGTVTNQGTLSAQSASTLSVSNLAPNAGTIHAGQGSTVAVTGGLTNLTSGQLTIDIGGTAASKFGRVSATGAATLGGTLSITLVGGYQPVAGDSVAVLSFASHSGDFTTVTGLTLPNGLVFNRTFSSTAMTLTAANALTAAAAPAFGGAASLSMGELLALYNATVTLWVSNGLPDALAARLRSVTVAISDLPGLTLGASVDSTIVVDQNAAGWGWFVDATPGLDEEFGTAATTTELSATSGSAADGHIDLVTVILHEQAHLLGLEHSLDDPALALMLPTLSSGTRRKLNPDVVDKVLAENGWLN
jgi:hypothetical protein